MKQAVIAVYLGVLMSGNCFAADKIIEMSTDPQEVVSGELVQFHCEAQGEVEGPLKSAKIVISNLENPRGSMVVSREAMDIDGTTARYDFVVPAEEQIGNWKFKCVITDQESRIRDSSMFEVVAAGSVESPVVEPPVVEPPDVVLINSPIEAHNSITNYDGPTTCIGCHQQEAAEMLDSLHMKWSGPTPDMTNSDGEESGKAVKGINTFCTYAMSSKAACFSCHVRADGNAPDPIQAEDVDCLMCHSDTYQRKFVSDPDNTETVTNILGQMKTYVFGKVDEAGNYTTVPDYAKMPEGTSMVNVARAVHIPTNDSCLRCHAKAGGGDWTKRGDMGLNSTHATVDQDVHLAKDGANLSCVDCHSALNHKIGGRGIDLRQTEAAAPTCKACHDDSPHSNAILNRHAQGQLSCQVCHIREYAKGGATEMSRDWNQPVWNEAFCSGQGGFVGHEVKEANVKPEYVWFDGTSYVYNVGETIEANPDTGVFNMAKANGTPFDGKSQIVPIKRHSSIMPWHESGKMVPPVIMWMFMTGDFDLAVKKGMEEQGMTGTYSIVNADAEMLITHGVDPKEKAPSCAECHSNSGSTADGAGMIPFEALGYHEVPAKVKSCNLCHEQKSMNWQSMHTKHKSQGLSCVSCHTSEPVGLVKAQSTLCSSCHERKSWQSEGHKKHIEKRVQCATCHTFS
ncbi:MAG: hypothetical protein ACI8ZB_003665 [Desulforhopalus sp.]|jgi:hypothetical protein